MAISAYQRGVVMAILAGAFLSIAGIGMRLLDGASALQVTFYRALGLAVFMFFVLLIRYRSRLPRALIGTGWVGLAAGAAFAAASWCVVFAIANTKVANVMFIVSLAPFFAALLGWIILRERVGKRTWIAIGIAVFGVFIMARGGMANEGLVGILYSFAMAFFYGCFIVMTRVGKTRDMLPVVFWSGLILAAACALIMDSFVVTPKDAVICLSLGVFQVGLGGMLLVTAAKYVPAAQIVFLAMLEVVLSPLWVWLGVGETPAIATLVGGTIIMMGIAYQALGVAAEPQPNPQVDAG